MTRTSQRRGWARPIAVLLLAIVVAAIIAATLSAGRQQREAMQAKPQTQTQGTFLVYVHSGAVPQDAAWAEFEARYGKQLRETGVVLRDADIANGVPDMFKHHVTAVPDVVFVDTNGEDGIRIVHWADVEWQTPITVDTIADFVRRNGWMIG